MNICFNNVLNVRKNCPVGVWWQYYYSNYIGVGHGRSQRLFKEGNKIKCIVFNHYHKKTSTYFKKVIKKLPKGGGSPFKSATAIRNLANFFFSDCNIQAPKSNWDSTETSSTQYTFYDTTKHYKYQQCRFSLTIRDPVHILRL